MSVCASPGCGSNSHVSLCISWVWIQQPRACSCHLQLLLGDMAQTLSRGRASGSRRLAGEECLHHCSRRCSWAKLPCALRLMEEQRCWGRGLAQALEAGEPQRRWFPHSTDRRTDTRGHTQAPHPPLPQGAWHGPVTLQTSRSGCKGGPPGVDQAPSPEPQTSQKKEPQARRGM